MPRPRQQNEIGSAVITPASFGGNMGEGGTASLGARRASFSLSTRHRHGRGACPVWSRYPVRLRTAVCFAATLESHTYSARLGEGLPRAPQPIQPVDKESRPGGGPGRLRTWTRSLQGFAFCDFRSCSICSRRA
jgi:hypothetical protein